MVRLLATKAATAAAPLWLWLPLWLWAASCTAAAPPVLHYEFLREQCPQGQFEDSSGLSLVGDLLLNPAHTSCKSSNGVLIAGAGSCDTFTPAQSALNVSTLAALLGDSDGYTIEVWAETTVPTTSTKVLYHMSVMPDDDATASGLCAKGGDLGVGLGESGMQKLMALNFNFKDSLSAPSCNTANAAIGTTLSGVHQFVYQVSNNVANQVTLEYYVDGVQQGLEFQTSASYDPDFMDPTHKLFLGSVGSPQSWACSFQGTIYQLSMYDYRLNSTEISNSFDRKIANSLPIAQDIMITVPEDGKYPANISDPADYRFPFPPDEVIAVACPYYDFDEDVNSFTYKPTNPRALCRIDIIPSVADAELFTLAGEPITAGTVLDQNDNVQFRIRPAFNRNEYTFDIGFTIIDGVDSREDSATITIYVEPVNDPPQATTTFALAMAKVKKAILQFNVTDVDSDVVGIRVAGPPQRGELYTVNFLGIVQNDVLNVGDTVGHLRIGYKYTADDELMYPERGVVFEDSFQLEFRDVEGFYSAPAAVVVTVIPALLAIPSSTTGYSFVSSTDPVVYEEGGRGSFSDNIFRIYALDYSEANPDHTFRDLAIHIDSIPSMGALSVVDELGETQQLTSGTEIQKAMTFVQSTAQYRLFFLDLIYDSAIDYFNRPTVTWQASLPLQQQAVNFSFHVKEFNSTAIARSEPAMQNIRVHNVNDPVTVTVPTQRLRVEAVGSNNDGSDTLVIHGFNVTDVDREVSPVRVTIKSAAGGRITLNQMHVGVLDFNSQGICRQQDFDDRWKCAGSGSSDSFMTFTGSPKAVQQGLNGLTYRNVKANVLDTISITIYDGAYHGPHDTLSRECIDKEDIAVVDPSSVFPECFVVQASFNVEVGNVAFQTSGGADDVPTNVIAASVGLACVAVGVIVVAIRRNFCGTKVETWGDSANEDGVEVLSAEEIAKIYREAEQEYNPHLSQACQNVIPETNAQENSTDWQTLNGEKTTPGQADWVSYMSKSGPYAGRRYYVNKATRRTTWTEPELLEALEQAPNSTSVPPTPPAIDDVRVSFRDVYDAHDPDYVNETKGPEYL